MVATLSPIRVLLLDGAVSTVWAVLSYLDFLFRLAIELYKAMFNKMTVTTDYAASQKKSRVVIVGASFAGLKTAYDLTTGHHGDDLLEVTVVEYKDYFEYIPGSLRCFVDPHHFQNALAVPLASVLCGRGIRLVQAQVIGVNVGDGNNDNQVVLDNGKTLAYDYLVLAAGSTYASPVKATLSTSTIKQRQAQWNRAAYDLKQAQSILIVGVGAVGVELAGEILTTYPQKRVILVDVAKQVLTGFRPSSVRYATTWLREHGAELRLGVAPLTEIGESSVTFADGSILKVNLVYKCMGAKPADGFLKNSPLSSACKGPKGSVMVNDYLQVQGFENVYCAGDLCFHPASNEIKLAHTAEINAHLVAANIIRSASSSNNGPDLLTYPSGVVGNDETPQIYDVSLGKYDATLGFNALVINGGVAALLKWLIEWTKVAAVAQRPIGVVFWIMGDAVSNLLGRTVLPTPRKQKQT